MSCWGKEEKGLESEETFSVPVFFGDLFRATFVFCNLKSKIIRMW